MKTILGVMAAILLTLLIPLRCQAAPQGFTTHGTHIMHNGQPWIPYGFSEYTFGNGTMAFAHNEYANVAAQERAIAGAWHGNVVRLQVGQDAYLYGSNGQSPRVFRDKVTAAINYAEALGLVVVINDTTEASGNLYTKNEPGPTSDTLAFWRALNRQNDPDIILDLFNEPRYPAGQLGNWPLLFHGNNIYLGEDTLIKAIRAMGYRNQLWVESTGNMALYELIATWPKYKVSDPLGNFVYEYHHTTVDENSVPTVSQWDAQFGDLITADKQPVVEGEWTNRSVVPGTASSVFEPSGDVGQCWGNAPVSVPAYLAYLQARGVGMTVWALGPGPAYQSYDMINADGDNTLFTSANNYDHWQGCITPKGEHTSGAGQLIMNWFTQQDKS